MAKVFKKRPATKFNRPNTTTKEEIVDPVLYLGGLGTDKYPLLPLDVDKIPEEEVENPLNKR